MLERLSASARRIINLAQAEVTLLGQDAIAAHHIFLGCIIADKELFEPLFEDTDLTVNSARRFLASLTPPAVPGDATFSFSPSARSAVRLAVQAHLSEGTQWVEPKHLFTGSLLAEDPVLSRLLEAFGLTSHIVTMRFVRLVSEEDESDLDETETADERELVSSRGSEVLPERPSADLKLLPRFAVDLVEKARAGKLDPVAGRSKEVERMITILCRRTKNNPVLIGEAGVGKTAVVEGFAQRIADGSVPAPLLGRSVWALDMASMVGGTQYRGDFEERLKGVIAEVQASNSIVFIDEVHQLVSAGTGATGGGQAAADLLKPALSRSELTLIGATTLDEYRRIEKDPALERRFAPVTVSAPTVALTVEILKTLRPSYEDYHKVFFSDAALEAAARLTNEYIPDRQLPDKAIDVLDEAGAAAALSLSELPRPLHDLYERRFALEVERRAALLADEPSRAQVIAGEILALTADICAAGDDVASLGSLEIARVVSSISGVDLSLVSTSESERLLDFEGILSRRVIGQDEAKASLARGVRRRRAGMSAHRPLSFIFAGPSGVGKTELAKAVSEALSGDDRSLVHIDMSEYSEKHNVSRLIGAPPGYVGFEQAGLLTEPVRRKPASVILLDEVEKAHPDVFNVFLQVLEDGHLSDSSGRRVDFSNAILIFTTNLGVSHKARSGFAPAGASGAASSRSEMLALTSGALKETFRPEFLNRIDEVLVFDALSESNMLSIASLIVARVADQLAALGVTLKVDESALRHLALSSDPALGARPLRSTIQRALEDRLSMSLLDGSLSDGDVVELVFDGSLMVRKVERVLS